MSGIREGFSLRWWDSTIRWREVREPTSGPLSCGLMKSQDCGFRTSFGWGKTDAFRIAQGADAARSRERTGATGVPAGFRLEANRRKQAPDVTAQRLPDWRPAVQGEWGRLGISVARRCPTACAGGPSHIGWVVKLHPGP